MQIEKLKEWGILEDAHQMKKQEGREGKLKVQMKTEDDGRNEQQGGTRVRIDDWNGYRTSTKILERESAS